MKKLLSLTLLISLTPIPALALETTVYGKITGIETRAWGLHVQTDFAGGQSLNCGVTPGQTYMYDFLLSRNVENAEFIQATLLTAFTAGLDVSFHMYVCNGPRPTIDHVRIKQ